MSKFNYLTVNLEADALPDKSNLDITVIIQLLFSILKESFGDENIVKEADYYRLIPIPTSGKVLEKRRATIDEIDIFFRRLEGSCEDTSHFYWINLIRSKIPKEGKEPWARQDFLG